MSCRIVSERAGKKQIQAARILMRTVLVLISTLKPQLDVADGAPGRDGRREATPQQAHACKKERQSRAPEQVCQAAT